MPTGGNRNEGSNPTFILTCPIHSGAYQVGANVLSEGQSANGLLSSVASVSNVLINTLTPLENTVRVSSGVGTEPAYGTYGNPYDSTQSLLANSELQYIGNNITLLQYFQYPPSINYSTYLPSVGPDYTTVSGVGVRYVNVSLFY